MCTDGILAICAEDVERRDFVFMNGSYEVGNRCVENGTLVCSEGALIGWRERCKAFCAFFLFKLTGPKVSTLSSLADEIQTSRAGDRNSQMAEP